MVEVEYKRENCGRCGKGLNKWWLYCPVCGTKTGRCGKRLAAERGR